MGCDCGCGGECPMCANILEVGMVDRFSQINQALEREGLVLNQDNLEDEEKDEA